MEEELQLVGKISLRGKIEINSGLAIGGSTSSLDIGGMDSPVIKDPQGIPYIPGSSIKGRLRSLLEQSEYPLRNEDKNDGKGYFHPKRVVHMFRNGDKIDEIIQIFGASEVDEPGRGIFRDASFDLDYFKENKEQIFKNLELPYTEDKIENTVNRISARANPRHLERVPMGTFFDFEIIMDLYSEEDKELIKYLFKGLKLLEDDYLGGSGTRGSGNISFKNMKLLYRPMEYYLSKEEEITLHEDFDLKDIKTEDWFTDVFNKINF